ncbi:hypothetical protein MHM39_15255 [Phaeobacter sp. CNT1-3]|nr:hypothetical protein [Phaeobacter sp. CNT1-3]
MADLMADEHLKLPVLTENCESCAAICCVAYPFDGDEDFAIVKAADTPCPNLGPDFRCTIHKDLKIKGFTGCTAYSCAGAGQRITQELFADETWHDDPDLIWHMAHALRVIRPIHEALLLLSEAMKLPIPPAAAAEGRALMAAMCPEEDTSIHGFEEPEVQEALADVPRYLQSLAGYL